MLPGEISSSLQIPRHAWEQMRQDVARRAPEEACGLIAGRRMGGRLVANLLFITTNQLHSATRFRVDPHEQLAAFNQMESQGLELVGIYHSHPQGPDEPSITDLAEAYFPEAVHLIWSGRDGEWACAAYLIQAGCVTPVSIQLLEAQA
jgi:proteasome lid subunit RPN8/RPN11